MKWGIIIYLSYYLFLFLLMGMRIYFVFVIRYYREQSNAIDIQNTLRDRIEETRQTTL